MQKKWNVKSFLINAGLILILIFLFYSFVGILITGPIIKYESDTDKIVKKIKNENKEIVSVDKNIFVYTTYTGESEDCYYFFNTKGIKLSYRKKEDAKFAEIHSVLQKQYKNLEGQEIHVAYGENEPIYIIEKGYERLVLDFDDLEVLFYMKEGE